MIVIWEIGNCATKYQYPELGIKRSDNYLRNLREQFEIGQANLWGETWIYGDKKDGFSYIKKTCTILHMSSLIFLYSPFAYIKMILFVSLPKLSCCFFFSFTQFTKFDSNPNQILPIYVVHVLFALYIWRPLSSIILMKRELE